MMLDTLVVRRETTEEGDSWPEGVWVYDLSDAGRAYWTLHAFEGTVIIAQPKTSAEEDYVAAEDYPALAEMWDNDADAVYDEL